jgi:2-methylaconitate cis-trans-isomerase PrpF
MTERAIPCMVMRGGTSKGLYFLASDLPADIALRDAVLLAAMGSPDIRQIDGMGGADPLTSKIAVVSPPSRDDADVDYLFLQAVVDQPRIDPSQNHSGRNCRLRHSARTVQARRRDHRPSHPHGQLGQHRRGHHRDAGWPSSL